MEVPIRPEETEDVFMTIAHRVLELLQDQLKIGYIVTHNEDDDTAIKTGVDEDDVLWVARYDDKAVE